MVYIVHLVRIFLPITSYVEEGEEPRALDSIGGF